MALAESLFFDKDNSIRGSIADAFSVRAAKGFSTASSKASMSAIFSEGVRKVKKGDVTHPNDELLISRVRSFADQPMDERLITIRNLFLKALIVTFPKMHTDNALIMASVKALLTKRESGGVVTWNLQGSVPFINRAGSGYKNMNDNQRYGSGMSGTGLVQWTADRQVNLLNRLSTLAKGPFSHQIAFIDPLYQAFYWAAELAEHAGLNEQINGYPQTSGVFFSDGFKDLLTNPRATTTVGHILGAFMLWQAGAGFGTNSEVERRSLIYGSESMNLKWHGGITARDFYNAYKAGLTGYYYPSDTATVRQFCEGIDKYVRKGKGYPYDYRPINSYFYKKITPVKGKRGWIETFDTFIVTPDQDLLSLFNLK
jgi:hypothetical protein